MDVDIEILATKISYEQLQRLPDAIRTACMIHPSFQVRELLKLVAQGDEEKAHALLNRASSEQQTLLRTTGRFTDYSGRVFECTAFEYAYWAKDIYMCRMLASHMDQDTISQLLARIDQMERIDSSTGMPTGLVYQQDGIEKRSRHFDFTPLKTALEEYIRGNSGWITTKNEAARLSAWMAVGKAQRNVPAHVAHEYCLPSRSFQTTPSFCDEKLERTLKFFNWITGRNDVWFPLPNEPETGLGFKFALMQDRLTSSWDALHTPSPALPPDPSADLNAIINLDLVRSKDLITLKEQLLEKTESRLSLS
jgi:hypothetical protein